MLTRNILHCEYKTINKHTLGVVSQNSIEVKRTSCCFANSLCFCKTRVLLNRDYRADVVDWTKHVLQKQEFVKQ